MKHLIAALFTSAAIAVSAADEATIASTNDITVTANETVVTANATLKDGSTVKGEFTTKRITGSTIFMEKLELDPALVKTVTFVNTNGESKIELNNGDKFAMTVADEAFAIKSLLGELNIPRTIFRSITLSSRRISASAIISTPTLLSFTHDPKLDPEFSTKSPFLIDEFKIWNYAKTDFSL